MNYSYIRKSYIIFVVKFNTGSALKIRRVIAKYS